MVTVRELTQDSLCTSVFAEVRFRQLVGAFQRVEPEARLFRRVSITFRLVRRHKAVEHPAFSHSVGDADVNGERDTVADTANGIPTVFVFSITIAPDGRPFRSPAEVIAERDETARLAAEERERSARLAAKLRALGVDPDGV